MGLDVTHDCWHGAYSGFMRWRIKICEVAGYGDLMQRQGFGGDIPFPQDDPLTILLDHSDNDGEIEFKYCKPIADRLLELIPALKKAGDGGGHIGSYADKTQAFIDGLLLANRKKENIEFR